MSSEPTLLPSWFERGAQALTARLTGQGGFTVNPRTGAAPTSGYAVNTGTGALVVPAQSVLGPGGTRVLGDFLLDRPDLLDPTSSLLFGAWHETRSDRIVLSRVDHVGDRHRAVALGAAHRQTDVYDLAADRLLPTGFVR